MDKVFIDAGDGTSNDDRFLKSEIIPGNFLIPGTTSNLVVVR